MSGSENHGEKNEAAQPASPSKKPYTPPKLRRLGSVRELTLGTSPGGTEFGTKIPRKGM